jgi:hypothetical protein
MLYPLQLLLYTLLQSLLSLHTIGMYVAAKLGPSAGSNCLPRVGMSRLRRFLERRVEECYRRNVARIVPLLQRELTKAESKLLSTGNHTVHAVYTSRLCIVYVHMYAPAIVNSSHAFCASIV